MSTLAPLFLFLTISFSALGQGGSSHVSPRKGTFTGDLQLSPIGDGIHMKVVQSISYNDGLGHAISVPAAFETDGASIPRALWSIVGSPFSGGNYIEAAVIHDDGCVTRKYSWQVTHRMFYTAMLDSGVSEHQAKILYYGVRIGGPRWKTVIQQTERGKTAMVGGKNKGVKRKQVTKVVTVPSQTLTQAKVKAFDAELRASEANGRPLTIDQIDDRTPAP